MGSLGRYEADVCLVYKRKLKIENENSSEDIQNFLKKKKNFGKIIVTKKLIETIEDFEKEGYIGIVYEDWDELQYEYVKEDIKNIIENGGFEDDLKFIKPVVEKDLLNLDLNILKEYDVIPLGNKVDKEVLIEGNSNYIYCDSDNSFENKVKLSKQQLQDLIDGKCTMLLRGDGNGEHC